MAAAAGAVAQTGMSIINLLESRKGGASARSVAIRIMNFTDATFTLVHDECRGGEYTEGLKPPQTIAAKNQSGFMAESHGFMTGTEGYARYAIGDGSSAGATLVIKWNNPYSGSNSNVAKVEGSDQYQVATEGGSGNNASLSVKINGGPVAPAAPAAPAAVPDEQANADGQEYVGEGDEGQTQDGDEPAEEGYAQEGEDQIEGENYEGEGEAEGENYQEEGQGEGESYEGDGQAEGESYDEEPAAEEQNAEEEAQEGQYGEEDYRQR